MADPMHQARVDALMQKFMDADHDGNGMERGLSVLTYHQRFA